MKKYHIIMILLIIGATQGSLYLGRFVGREESKNEIDTLEHRVDSLTIENAMLINDAFYWQNKYENLLDQQ